MSSRSVTSILRRHGVRPRKGLGQHFLSETPTIEKIVRAIRPSEEECIVEIGPGPGIVTSMLAERAAQVIAIDQDGALLEIAREEFGDIPNITWIEADILEIDLKKILRTRGSRIEDRGAKIVGNLPYNISTPILFWIIDNRELVSRAVIMVQKEVAERIVAPPGGKDYGILSVQTQAHAKVKKLFDVSPTNFTPPPEVISSVIEIDFSGGSAVRPEDESIFKEVVRGAFGKRRKTIRNSLIGSPIEGISAERVDRALDGAGIDAGRRPETLTVDEYIRLASLMKS